MDSVSPYFSGAIMFDSNVGDSGLKYQIFALCITYLTTPAIAFETVAILSGTGQVIDGDGILFGDVEVRLQGIAAPEDNSHGTEAGGAESTANLQELVDGEMVVCHLDGSTAGMRPVGICFVN